MAEQRLGASEFTLEWVLENSSLKKRIKNVKEFAGNCQITQFPDEDSGYLSDVFRISLPPLSDSAEKLSLIVKIPSLTRARAMVPPSATAVAIPDSYLCHIHNSECTFYDVFGQENSDLPLAECFLARKMQPDQPGIIVLLDLQEKADFVPLWEGLNYEQCRSFVSNLAQFHARCLKFPEVPEGKFPDRDPSYYLPIPGFFSLCQEVLPAYFPDVFTVSEIRSCGWSPEEAVKLVSVYKDFQIPSIIVHGDPWANNLMFRRSTDGIITGDLVAIIDWQESHPGTLTEDIARMLVNSCSTEFRRKNTEKILQFYSEELRKFLGDGDGSFPQITYSLIKELYDKQMVYSVGCYCLELGLLLSSPRFSGEENQGKVMEMVARLKGAIEDVYGQQDK